MGPGVERNSLEITTLGRELGWTTLSDSIQRQLQSDIYILSVISSGLCLPEDSVTACSWPGAATDSNEGYRSGKLRRAAAFALPQYSMAALS